MASQPVLQGYVLEIMASWLEQLIEKIDELTLCDGAQRLARYLVGLHEKNPYAGFVTAAQVELPTRKRDLATKEYEAYLKIENVLDRDYQLINGYNTSGRAVYVGLQAKF